MVIKNQIDQFFQTINSDKNNEFINWLILNLRTFDQITHGHWTEWLKLLATMPKIPDQRVITINQAIVEVHSPDFFDKESLNQLLKKLSPWRKGPFSLYGISIDTEWRSDLKWDRLALHITPLKDRRVLDVGTGSGYHLWRMLGSGARCAVGVEPTAAFIAQFYAVAHLLGDPHALIIPTTLEHISRKPIFDTVFSMGVLYHRRNPISHLQELSECLRPGGELVLETLIIESDAQNILTPENRYAAMRNIWFIPSIPLLTVWLNRIGYTDVRIVNIERTSLNEQRATEWTDFKPSLVDFLDPQDQTKTIEGYPSPLRAIIIATKI